MSNDFYKNLGELLKEYRVKANMTQDEVAAKLRTGRTTISNYELGVRKIPLDLLKEYCQAIDLDMQEIVNKL